MKLFGFNKTKNVKGQMEALRTFINAAQAGQLGNDYNVIRASFNVQVVGSLIGSVFVKNAEGVLTTSGWVAMPDKSEFTNILLMADEFILTVESKWEEDSEDDMRVVNPLGRNIPVVEDITNEKFKEIILSVINKRLSKEDFLMISDLAERLRKHNYRLMGYWAAGITIAIAAGVGAYLYTRGKEEKTEEVVITTTSEYDDVGSDIMISVDDDMPIVIISDDPMGVRVI